MSKKCPKTKKKERVLYRYGHPHEWAMENLEDYSMLVYNTKDDFAVEFFIGDDITVNTFGEKE